MFLLEAIGVHVQKNTNIVERERRVKKVNIQKEAEQGSLIALALLYGSGCGVGRSHGFIYLVYWLLVSYIITASTIRYTRKRVSLFCGTRISTVVGRTSACFPLRAGTEVINVYSGI